MKQIYAFENKSEYEKYEHDIKMLNAKLKPYKHILIRDFELKQLPKTVIWTSSELATSVFSRLPVPAFTNQDTIYMTPSVDEWRKFYLSQLEGEALPQNEDVQHIKDYFHSITIDDVFCILAHELTHHIELFPDEFEDEHSDSIWFEEGMCEYLSQKLTLTNEQFLALRENNERLIKLFKPKYGQYGLDQFGTNSYGHKSLAAIMLNYWRSAAAIHYLVEERFAGNIGAVFEQYHKWHTDGRKQQLTAFFDVEQF